LTIAGNHFVETSVYERPPAAETEGLKWSVAVMRSDKQIKFDCALLGDEIAVTGAPVEVRPWGRGVRCGAVAAVAASELGMEEWQAGQTIALRASLRDQREPSRMTEWSATLTLSPEPRVALQRPRAAGLAP
jgi:hypothetical protein